MIGSSSITDNGNNHIVSWDYQCSDINERRVSGQKITGNAYFNKPEKIEIKKVKFFEIFNVLCFDGVLSWSLPKSHGEIICIKDHNRRSYNPDYELFVSITKTHFENSNNFQNSDKASFILKDEFVKSFDYKNSNPLRDIFFNCISNSEIDDLTDEEDNNIQITDLGNFWSTSTSFITHLIVTNNTRDEYRKLYQYYRQLLENRPIINYLKHAIHNIIKSFKSELSKFKLPYNNKIPESIKTKAVRKSSSPLVNDNIRKFYFNEDKNKKSSDISKKRPITDSQKSKEGSIQSSDESVIYDDVDFSSLLEDVSRIIDSNVDNSNVINNQSSSAVIVDSSLGYRQIIFETRYINQFENNRNNITLNANNSNFIPIHQSQLSLGQLTTNDIFNQTSRSFLSPYNNSSLSSNSSYQPNVNVTSNASSNSHCNAITIDDYEDDDVDHCYKKVRNDNFDYAEFHDFDDDDIDKETFINQFEEDDNLSSDFMDSPDVTGYHIRNSTVPSTNINNISRFNSLEIDSNENIFDSNSSPVADIPVIILNPTTVSNNTDNLDSSEIRDLDIFDHNL